MSEYLVIPKFCVNFAFNLFEYFMSKNIYNWTTLFTASLNINNTDTEKYILK